MEEVASQSTKGDVGGVWRQNRRGPAPRVGGTVFSLSIWCHQHHSAASGWETSRKHEKAGGADTKGARQLPLPGAGQSVQDRRVPPG